MILKANDTPNYIIKMQLNIDYERKVITVDVATWDKRKHEKIIKTFPAEEFELALLYYETYQYSDEKYITLKEAIDKYGEDNLSYYNNQPLNSVGWISKNPDGAVFGYTFNAEFVTR